MSAAGVKSADAACFSRCSRCPPPRLHSLRPHTGPAANPQASDRLRRSEAADRQCAADAPRARAQLRARVRVARRARSRPTTASLPTLKQRYERDSAIMTKDDADALKREIDAPERANKRMHDEARSDLNARAATPNATAPGSDPGHRHRLRTHARLRPHRAQPGALRQSAHRHYRCGAAAPEANRPQVRRSREPRLRAFSLASLAERFALELRGDGTRAIERRRHAGCGDPGATELPRQPALSRRTRSLARAARWSCAPTDADAFARQRADRGRSLRRVRENRRAVR